MADDVQDRAAADDVLRLVLQHSCPRGLLCPVKQATLAWRRDGPRHCLDFVCNPHRFACAHTGPLNNTVQISVVYQGYRGSLTCDCDSPFCAGKLVATLCALSHLTQ